MPKVRKGGRSKRKRKDAEVKKQTVAELCDFAEKAMAQFNLVSAAQFYMEAINVEPKNPVLHHRLGVVLTEGAKVELAYDAFCNSIDICPDDIPSNYLYIAQQCFGSDALRAYQCAIEMMEKELARRSKAADGSSADATMDSSSTSVASSISCVSSDSSETKTESTKSSSLCSSKKSCAIGSVDAVECERLAQMTVAQLRKETGRALCGIGELFMTDLCDLEQAQERCEKALKRSVELCPSNCECQCTLGELHFLLQQMNAANDCFHIAFRSLFSKGKKQQPVTGEVEEEEEEEEEEGDYSAVAIGTGVRVLEEETKIGADDDTYADDADVDMSPFVDRAKAKGGKCSKMKEELCDEMSAIGSSLEPAGVGAEELLTVDIDSDMTVDGILKVCKLGIELLRFAESLKLATVVLNCNDALADAWALGALCHFRLGHLEDAKIWIENSKSIAEDLFKQSGDGDDDCDEGPNVELRLLIENVIDQIDYETLPDLSALTLDAEGTVSSDEEVEGGSALEDGAAKAKHCGSGKAKPKKRAAKKKMFGAKVCFSMDEIPTRGGEDAVYGTQSGIDGDVDADDDSDVCPLSTTDDKELLSFMCGD